LPASTTAIAFTATNDPRVALVVCILTIIAEAGVGFATKVWQQLESRWVDRASDWLDIKVLSFFSGYSHRYLEYIGYQHRSFDVKGLTTQGIHTLELERVFVQLRIDTTSAHQAATNPIASVPTEPPGGSRTIWEYLKSSSLGSQHFAIIGAPGSGKTTLLKHIALILASSSRQRRRMGIPNKLPILLYLRDYAAAIGNDPSLPLGQMVREQLAKWQAPTPPHGWLESYLDDGLCLIMFDGLDEVADPDIRRKVVNWVEKTMIAYGKNRFIISSRPHGYKDNPLSGVTVLRVLPFTQNQIETFVNNWYLANEIMSHQKSDPGVRAIAQQGAEDLLARIRKTPALSDLAVNPLLLTMISTIHRFKSTLPGRRVELYKEICETFLGKRHQARDLELSLTPMQKQRVLQPLAYHMMVRETREVKLSEAIQAIAPSIKTVCPEYLPEAFLKMIENSSGLLVERESGVYSFAHKTFQEYLAATVVCEYRGQLESRLAAQVNNGWWHEAIRLYCAQTNASAIIAACLAAGISSSPALALAIACMEEAREVSVGVRHKYEAAINQGVEDTNPERRRVIAEALLSLRLQRMTRINEDLWIDSTPITCVEYQLFLETKEGQTHYPDHWLSGQFSRGNGKKPVVGVRFSDAQAFCNWLADHVQGDWSYRLPTREEASSFAIALAESKNPLSYWVIDSSKSPTLFHVFKPSTLNSHDLQLVLHHDYSLACLLANRLGTVLPKYSRHWTTPIFEFLIDLFHRSGLDALFVKLGGLSKVLDFSIDSILARETARQTKWLQELGDSFDIDLGKVLSGDKSDLDVSGIIGWPEEHIVSVLSQGTALDLDHIDSVVEDFSHRVVRALALKFERDLLVISALERILTPLIKQIHTRATYIESERAGSLSMYLEPALSLASKLDVSYAHALEVARHHVMELPNARRLAASKAKNVELAHEIDKAVKEILRDKRALNRLRTRVYLLFVAALFEPAENSGRFGFLFARRLGTKAQQLALQFFNAYKDFLILEERIEGNVSAFEGIRIVKERKNQNSAT
jgi:energy-coupling factor transporter ATP-binding protein EcfA2